MDKTCGNCAKAINATDIDGFLWCTINATTPRGFNKEAFYLSPRRSGCAAWQAATSAMPAAVSRQASPAATPTPAPSPFL
jgi:hypothetical protein